MPDAEPAPLLVPDAGGLACVAGGFHVDPRSPVPVAVLTGPRRPEPGCARYLVAAPAIPLLRLQLGPDAAIEALPYGERRRRGEVELSLHPSGHVRGGAQVRIERAGEVSVVAPSWTRGRDPATTPFEVVRADVFVTGATFALPIYRWPAIESVVEELVAWWEENREQGRPTALYARSPGPAERILAVLAERTDRAVLVHPDLEPALACHREAGVRLATTSVFDGKKRRSLAGELVVAPPAARATPWAKKLAKAESGLASGVMRVRGARRRGGFDRGFVVAEEPDWFELQETIAAVGARRVLATHGRAHVLARALRERGLDAGVLETGWTGEELP